MTAEGWVSTPLPLSQTQTPAEVSHAHTPSLPTPQPLVLLPSEGIPALGSSTPTIKKKRGLKGWEGEIVPSPHHSLNTPADGNAYDVFTPLRKIVTVPNEGNGSATSHVIVHCTLADIARATNLRVEDTAFALCECGLLERAQGVRRSRSGTGTVTLDGTVMEDVAHSRRNDERMVVGVTREMVESVAKERRVKEMCLSLAHVLL